MEDCLLPSGIILVLTHFVHVYIWLIALPLNSQFVLYIIIHFVPFQCLLTDWDVKQFASYFHAFRLILGLAISRPALFFLETNYN